MPLVVLGQRFVALECAEMARQFTARVLMRRVQLEDRFECLGCAFVIQVLFVVDACDALVERDFLARRNRQLYLCAQHVEQLAIAACASQHAVEAPQSVDEARIFGQYLAVSLLGRVQLVEIDVVRFCDFAQELMSFVATQGLRAGLPHQQRARRVARCVEQRHQTCAGLFVTWVFLQHRGIQLARGGRVVQARGQHLGCLHSKIAGQVRGRDVRAAQEHLPVLRPLLGLLVDLRQLQQGRVVIWLSRHQLRQPRQSQIRAHHPLGVPAAEVKEQRVTFGSA